MTRDTPWPKTPEPLPARSSVAVVWIAVAIRSVGAVCRAGLHLGVQVARYFAVVGEVEQVEEGDGRIEREALAEFCYLHRPPEHKVKRPQGAVADLARDRIGDRPGYRSQRDKLIRGKQVIGYERLPAGVIFPE